MTPKDIIVGALYKHKEHPGTIYLGCGDLFYGVPFRRKFMIIVQEPLASYNLSGVKVAFRNKPESRKWWKQFTATKNTL